MISNLVEELIDNADLYTKELHDLMYRAAYTIEMMSKRAKESKQGEWIAYKGMQPPEFHGKHYCSNCYHAIHLASNGNVYNYCPKCGARMKGADDETD